MSSHIEAQSVIVLMGLLHFWIELFLSVSESCQNVVFRDIPTRGGRGVGWPTPRQNRRKSHIPPWFTTDQIPHVGKSLVVLNKTRFHEKYSFCAPCQTVKNAKKLKSNCFCLYRVYCFILRTLSTLFIIENEVKYSWKMHGSGEEGCDFYLQLLFYSYVETNVFYKLWHLKLLIKEIKPWSYIWLVLKKWTHNPLCCFFICTPIL